jgi:quercetin dioxygenase-like cupin family protein
MDIRRFGIGHRRPDGPSGTHGVEGQQIHADARGVIAEVALKPHAALAPHTNPNPTYFLVIEGGGFVRVGDETARVAAGEAVVWPSGVIHAAWTDATPMRAIVVEFASDDAARLLPDGRALELTAADGELSQEPPAPPSDRASSEEEPW